MAVATNGVGRVDWTFDKDDQGYRTYNVTYRVEVTDPDDGPQVALSAAGLPTTGSYWTEGNDADLWALCLPYRSVRPVRSNEPNKQWDIGFKFSNRPITRCQDTNIDNPLLEPQKVSGSFVKYLKEATRNRDGSLIKTSSHEQVRGAQVEFDANRPTVHIDQNVLNLDLASLASFIDTVNDSTLWGLSSRKIKLSAISWERLIYGTCTYYFRRSFDFNIDYNTFDRDVLDEGTLILNGHWARDGETGDYGDWKLDNVGGSPPDPDNPQHFIRATDRKGNPINVIYNGSGRPITETTPDWEGTSSTGPGKIHIEYYPESNFLLLGIPTDLASLGTA